ncbi:hypothetical protein ABPG73_016418 [Tetrahymena malaccensis]
MDILKYDLFSSEFYFNMGIQKYKRGTFLDQNAKLEDEIQEKNNSNNILIPNFKIKLKDHVEKSQVDVAIQNSQNTCKSYLKAEENEKPDFLLTQINKTSQLDSQQTLSPKGKVRSPRSVFYKKGSIDSSRSNTSKTQSVQFAQSIQQIQKEETSFKKKTDQSSKSNLNYFEKQLCILQSKKLQEQYLQKFFLKQEFSKRVQDKKEDTIDNVLEKEGENNIYVPEFLSKSRDYVEKMQMISQIDDNSPKFQNLIDQQDLLNQQRDEKLIKRDLFAKELLKINQSMKSNFSNEIKLQNQSETNLTKHFFNQITYTPKYKRKIESQISSIEQKSKEPTIIQHLETLEKNILSQIQQNENAFQLSKQKEELQDDIKEKNLEKQILIPNLKTKSKNYVEKIQFIKQQQNEDFTQTLQTNQLDNLQQAKDEQLVTIEQMSNRFLKNNQNLLVCSPTEIKMFNFSASPQTRSQNSLLKSPQSTNYKKQSQDSSKSGQSQQREPNIIENLENLNNKMIFQKKKINASAQVSDKTIESKENVQKNKINIPNFQAKFRQYVEKNQISVQTEIDYSVQAQKNEQEVDKLIQLSQKNDQNQQKDKKNRQFILSSNLTKFQRLNCLDQEIIKQNKFPKLNSNDNKTNQGIQQNLEPDDISESQNKSEVQIPTFPAKFRDHIEKSQFFNNSYNNSNNSNCNDISPFSKQSNRLIEDFEVKDESIVFSKKTNKSTLYSFQNVNKNQKEVLNCQSLTSSKKTLYNQGKSTFNRPM